MTCGIYLLCFGEDQVYVGQSDNIKRRIRAHKRSFITGTTSKKLLNAYKQYGEPEAYIYLECNLSELNKLEALTIIEFDSINNGLNTIDGNTPGGSGYTASSSKYSREEILIIFNLLCEGNTKPEVKNLTGVPLGTIGNIQSGNEHLWLREEFPEEYEIMREYATYYFNSIETNTARGKGYKYNSIISPDGIVYNDIPNIAEFARKHHLDRAGISRVLRGEYPVHLGWRVYNGL